MVCTTDTNDELGTFIVDFKESMNRWCNGTSFTVKRKNSTLVSCDGFLFALGGVCCSDIEPGDGVVLNDIDVSINTVE